VERGDAFSVHPAQNPRVLRRRARDEMGIR